MTQRTYPTDDALGVGVLTAMTAGQGSQGNGPDAQQVQLLGLQVWEMDSIWIDKV